MQTDENGREVPSPVQTPPLTCRFFTHLLFTLEELNEAIQRPLAIVVYHLRAAGKGSAQITSHSAHSKAGDKPHTKLSQCCGWVAVGGCYGSCSCYCATRHSAAVLGSCKVNTHARYLSSQSQLLLILILLLCILLRLAQHAPGLDELLQALQGPLAAVLDNLCPRPAGYREHGHTGSETCGGLYGVTAALWVKMRDEGMKYNKKRSEKNMGMQRAWWTEFHGHKDSTGHRY